MASTIKKTTNGFNYKYAELSVIHEELERQKITYYQYIEYDPNADADFIYTVLNYDGDEKTARRGCRVISGGESMKSAAQAQGSAITYARRYSLLMALGWATEDDDGATAGEPIKKSSRKIDFRSVREHLAEINTVEELNAYWQSLKLSDKQAGVLKADFAERKAKIGVGVGV